MYRKLHPLVHNFLINDFLQKSMSCMIVGFAWKYCKCCRWFIIWKIVDEKFFGKSDQVRACFRRIQPLSPFPSSLRAIILHFDRGFEHYDDEMYYTSVF